MQNRFEIITVTFNNDNVLKKTAKSKCRYYKFLLLGLRLYIVLTMNATPMSTAIVIAEKTVPKTIVLIERSFKSVYWLFISGGRNGSETEGTFNMYFIIKCIIKSLSCNQ